MFRVDSVKKKKLWFYFIPQLRDSQGDAPINSFIGDRRFFMSNEV